MVSIIIPSWFIKENDIEVKRKITTTDYQISTSSMIPKFFHLCTYIGRTFGSYLSSLRELADTIGMTKRLPKFECPNSCHIAHMLNIPIVHTLIILV